MSDCGLEDDGMKILCQRLRANRSIKALNLERSGITNVGIDALVENWFDNSPIKGLLFGCNRMDCRRQLTI
jgi:hypothetical protein